jgi:4-hydroxy-2-oxoheptanedioate aldolase
MRLRLTLTSGWFVVVVWAITMAWDHAPSAQQAPEHLNPAIEKLAQGKPVFGISTTDLSLDNASALARADLDYVRVEMEHTPMSFDTLRLFLLGTIDRASIVKKGNAQQSSAPIVRLAPYGREQAHWVTKQALDLGVMGIIFSTIETKEEALSAVRSMRYPQPRGARYMEPIGLRGVGPTNAVWFWGVSTAEYTQRADLWPLNPAGDLLAIMLIESVKGVENVDAIASVPGVGMIYAGTGDLSRSMGVSGAEVEAAVQKILKACVAHNVPCKINVTANDVQRRIKEGWRVLNVGALAGGLTPPIDSALRAGRAAVK